MTRISNLVSFDMAKHSPPKMRWLRVTRTLREAVRNSDWIKAARDGRLRPIGVQMVGHI